MINNNTVRNITIGLTDGLTIPFALATGMSAVTSSHPNIAAACIAAGAAGGITMSVSAYLEGKKYDNRNAAAKAALLVGISYFAGSILSALPYYIVSETATALRYSIYISLACLFMAGFFEGQVHRQNGLINGLRVMLTGAVAAAAAFLVASFFG